MKELTDAVQTAGRIIVIADGREHCFEKDDVAFHAIIKAWNEMTATAIRMPAFGVSIDELTRREMKQGLWTEFRYEKETSCAGMAFDRLLVCVKEEFRGFNVVRHLQEKYQGRCFYVDLSGGDMSGFAAAVKKAAGLHEE